MLAGNFLFSSSFVLAIAFILLFQNVHTANQPKSKIGTSSRNQSDKVEGSADGVKGRLADVEVNGSGYPTDDEDGDDVHGSGTPPAGNKPPKNIVQTSKKTTTAPATTLAPFKPAPVVETVATVDKQKEVIVDDSDADDDDGDEDDEDDDDFADENIVDDETTTTSTTSTTPLAVVTKPITQPAPQTTKPPRMYGETVAPDSTGPFSPFHETMTNGFYAAIAGGAIVAIITAILLVMFVVFRIRKKDEGSYALDEPKQTRPYATYAYTKASTKEFYA